MLARKGLWIPMLGPLHVEFRALGEDEEEADNAETHKRRLDNAPDPAERGAEGLIRSQRPDGDEGECDGKRGSDREPLHVPEPWIVTRPDEVVETGIARG